MNLYSVAYFLIITFFLGVQVGCQETFHITYSKNVSPVNSELTVSSSTVFVSEQITITLNLRDGSGEPYVSTHDQISFVTSGGTSTGIMSTVTNHFNGTYSAIFTAVSPGTPITVKAFIDAKEVTSAFPTITVLNNQGPAVQSIIGVHTGNFQTATVATALATPLRAIVTDLSAQPQAGVSVLWTVLSGGGTLSSCTSVSQSNGFVQCQFNLGTIAGAKIIRARISGSTASATFNITGLAAAPSVAQSIITINSGTLLSGNTATLTITLRDVYGNQVPDATKAGNLSISVLATGTSSATVGAISPVGGNPGVYQATLTGATAGTANTLKASLSGVDFTTLRPSFTVLTGAPSKLAFIQNPTTTAPATMISPSITVVAQDINNNIIPQFNANITISIAGSYNPTGATLSGTLTRTPSSGVATFNDLSLNYNGVGYRLAASSGSLAPAESTDFNISFIYEWPFTVGTTAQYTSSDWTKMRFRAGVCELTPDYQTISDASAMDFGSGSLSGVIYGTLSDTITSGLKLDPGGTPINRAFLESSWAPQWDSLIGYWKMDNNWNDSKGSNDGTAVNGATFTTQTKIGTHSGIFVNVDAVHYNDIFDNIFSGLNKTFTLSTWFNPSTIQESHIIAKSAGVAFTEDNHQFSLSMNATGQIEFIYYSSLDGSSSRQITGQTILSTYQWNYIVVTYNGSINSSDGLDRVKIYLNGNSESLTLTSSTGALGHIQDGTAPLAFGGSVNTLLNAADKGIKGHVDDVAIWSVILSDEEIKSIYARQSAKYSGEYISRVIDAGSVSSWAGLSWNPTLPFYKPLVDNGINETRSVYSFLFSDTLMNGLIGLWHLDEPMGTAGTNSIQDKSGANFHGTPTGSVSSFPGVINSSMQFNGTSYYIILGNSPLTITSSVSVSYWFNTDSLGSDQFIIDESGSSIYGGGLSSRITSTGKIRFWYITAGYFVDSTSIINPNQWYHVAVTHDGVDNKVYLNGVLENTTAVGVQSARDVLPLHIGFSPNLGGFFKGKLDEIALWDRAITSQEVKQLYQRGASRLKYNIRSCAINDCSDQDALVGQGWIGPNGEQNPILKRPLHYFTELNNNTDPLNATGTALSDFGPLLFSNLLAVPTDRRYFQYRAIFETDSDNIVDGPEITSVSVGQYHYDNSAPTIIGNNGVPFYEINSFTEELGNGGCSSGVVYNIGLSNTGPWMYWNGSLWAVSDGTSTQANSAADINSNINSFGSSVGRGTIYFKAFLQSSGLSKCELDKIQIDG